MITIKELKEHCERQLNKLPKGSKTYEEHLLTLNIIETLKEKDKYIKHSEEITTEMNEDINKLLIEIKQKDKQIDLMGEVIFEKFKAQLVIEYGIENKEQFVKLFKEKAKEEGK